MDKLFGLLIKWFGKSKGVSKFKKQINKSKIVLNYEKEPIDNRDYLLKTGNFVLPISFSLQNFCTPIKNQGSIGACSGFALTGAFEILVKKSLGEDWDTSELFTYYQARLKQGKQDKDSGAYLRDVCYSAANDGVCLEILHPYLIKNYALKPSLIAYVCSKKFKLTSYYKCYTINEIKEALVSGFPVIFGMKITSDFLNYQTGIYKQSSGSYAGGHAMCIIGYDDQKNAFLIRNSWGIGWGQKGYCWVDYGLFMQNLLDSWAIKYNPPQSL